MPLAQRAASFFDELVADLRRVKLEDVPAVAAAIRGAASRGSSSRVTGARPSTSPSSLSSLAASIVALDINGSKLDAVIDAVVLHAAEETNGNLSAAGRLLGLDRKTFTRRLAKARARAKRRPHGP